MIIGVSVLAGIFVVVAISLLINNANLKAKNSKLKMENNNLQYELGKTMLLNEEKENVQEVSLSQERINSIKDKFKKTSEIKPVKQATKEDVEAFYESQKNQVKKGNSLEK